MIEDSKYFISGYGHNDSAFGLIEKITKRIVFVAGDLELIRFVQLITSSKYELRIVDFSSAINYDSNLIDNTCCDTWTLSKEDLSSLDNTANSHTIQDPLCPNILEHKTPLSLSELVVQDREFFMFVYLCEFYRREYLRNNKHAWKLEIDAVASQLGIDLPFSNKFTEIRKILYLANDLAEAEAEIKDNYPNFLRKVQGE